MASRADRRTRGRAVVVVGGFAVVGLGIGLSSARPSATDRESFRDRLTADVHSEYVKYPSGKDTLTAYLAYPERRDPAPAVIVIHDIFGMGDRLRPAVELLAQRGFVAIGPDLLSRSGGTPGSADSARKLISGLDPDAVTRDLDATYAYLNTIKAVRRGQIGVIGFCWGGSQSFRYATNNPNLKAFVVCYGSAPDTTALARIKARGLGVYAENDARIGAGLPGLDTAVKRLRLGYQYRVYPGVGHAFLQTREKPDVADTAWAAIEQFLRTQLGR